MNINNILKYLRRTRDIFLIYGDGDGDLHVEGYTDASFQSNGNLHVNGGEVSWKCSKHKTTTDSTTEAEYIAASENAKEEVWIRKFISKLGVVPSIVDPVLFGVNHTWILSVFFMYLYNSNARFMPYSSILY